MNVTDAYTNKGNSIIKISEEKRVILVFLRHFGCNFCRETLSEINRIQSDFNEEEAKIILVHQSSKSYANKILPLYNLQDIEHVSDTGKVLFRSFGLQRHGYLELFKPKVLFGVLRSLVKGHFFGRPQSDPRQRPGIFVLKHGQIVDRFEYQHIAQMPPIVEIAS